MKEINLTYFKSKGKIYIPFDEHKEILKSYKEEIERQQSILKEIREYIDSITWSTNISNLQDIIWYILDNGNK